MKLRTIMTMLLALPLVLPLAAQVPYGGINGNRTAAFDPGWLYVYCKA